jgi:hypothetical protein
MYGKGISSSDANSNSWFNITYHGHFTSSRS